MDETTLAMAELKEYNERCAVDHFGFGVASKEAQRRTNAPSAQRSFRIDHVPFWKGGFRVIGGARAAIPAKLTCV